MLSEKTLRRLKELKAKRIMVQIPEGLKTRAAEMAGFLVKSGFEPITSVEPCFGACDLRDREAKALGCGALLHVGHSDFGVKAAIPVIYDEWASDLNLVNLVRKNIRRISGYERIGLLTTVQHTASLGSVRKFLESRGKMVFTGKSEKLKEGQILGCDASSVKSIESKVDCFIFIGSGRFHPLGLLQSVRKPVLFLDIESGKMSDISMEREKAEIRRQMRVEKARGLKRFAVFVSTKQGQMNIKKARKIRKLLLDKGREAFIISADTLTPDKIMGMGIEVLVNTACPRIYDDQEALGIVILNPDDVMEL
jgi:2-(3-amino-3-carboxypropyl)histidine synthase